ncbi:MAG: MFS transporter [Phycisphaerae bacterium]|nr:MFS transporter [Phycisphaerae bacterium]
MCAVNNEINDTRGVKLILRALKHRNYRLFFAGQSISLIGTWMQQVAISWLVYRMTSSAFYLGAVMFASQIPTCIAAPLAGVLADRWSRHKMIIVTQILSMLQATILVVLIVTHTITVWKIMCLSVFMGLINGFDIPIRQAFVYELVDRQEDIPNAIALNSLTFNGARLIGPSIAGVLIAAVGESVCFSLNAVSYLAVIGALLALKLTPRSLNRHNGHIITGFRDGLLYAYRFVPIRAILLLLALIGIIGMPYAVLMPVFAKDILHGGPRTLGFLMGAVGIGALCGAVFLASRRTVKNLDKIVVFAISIFAVGIIGFSFSRNVWLSLCLTLLAGFGMMVQMASINTILQTVVDDDKRGRIMSLYTMAFMGTAPIGSLLAGSIAHKIGAPHTLQISGVLCIIAAAVFWKKLSAIREMVHPVYVRKGIIPQVANGIGTVTQISVETKE